MSITTFPLTLKYSEMITPTVMHLAFSTEQDQSLAFIPGQFITIHFDWQEKLLKRSYSIATIPGKTNLIEIAASYFPGGPGTEFLFHLKPGDRVEASGPHGRLILKEEQPKRYILVATGTGVTPYRAMLPELAKRIEESGLEVVVLLGVKSREDLLYGNDFVEWQNQYPQFHFRAQYSRAFPTDAQQYEHQGYVQAALEQLNLDPKQDVIYLCGNPKMIDDAFEMLKNKGFDTMQVRREKYVSGPTPKT